MDRNIKSGLLVNEIHMKIVLLCQLLTNTIKHFDIKCVIKVQHLISGHICAVQKWSMLDFLTFRMYEGITNEYQQ